jgi:hypothetical protein
MRQHCTRGYEMVRKIPFLREASEIIYAHQESFDGSGYPRGLRGEQIPLGARIFAIADTLDAMTSDRPYRKGLSFAQARAEIASVQWTPVRPQDRRDIHGHAGGDLGHAAAGGPGWCVGDLWDACLEFLVAPCPVARDHAGAYHPHKLLSTGG